MSPTFTQSDFVLTHLDGYVGSITDPYIQSRYTGFVAVTAVTAFETNIRSKIFDFCQKKHSVFGAFAQSHFAKTNAKVKTQQLQDEYLAKFGPRYLSRFKKKMNILEENHLRTEGTSLKGSFNNLVQWRHDFVHDGVLPAFATYADARKAYDSGKLVVATFFDCLVR